MNLAFREASTYQRQKRSFRSACLSVLQINQPFWRPESMEPVCTTCATLEKVEWRWLWKVLKRKKMNWLWEKGSHQMIPLSLFTLMKAYNLQTHILQFPCSGPSISQPAGLLGHTFFILSIQNRLCEPLIWMVLLTSLSIIPLSKWLFFENTVLFLSLQETVNTGD